MAQVGLSLNVAREELPGEEPQVDAGGHKRDAGDTEAEDHHPPSLPQSNDRLLDRKREGHPHRHNHKLEQAKRVEHVKEGWPDRRGGGRRMMPAMRNRQGTVEDQRRHDHRRHPQKREHGENAMRAVDNAAGADERFRQWPGVGKAGGSFSRCGLAIQWRYPAAPRAAPLLYTLSRADTAQ